MERIIFLVITNLLLEDSDGASVHEQLNHIARRRQESRGLVSAFDQTPSRRADFHFDPDQVSGIIGVPSMPSHLPEAEPILPGHTLLRPALGMLKSAVKFPHRELENGFGVNGNIDNLGIKWDGKNERVLYSGFRRMPADYLMVMPNSVRNSKPGFDVASVVLDMDKRDTAGTKLLDILGKIRKPVQNNIVYYISNNKHGNTFERNKARHLNRKPHVKLSQYLQSRNIDKKSREQISESDERLYVLPLKKNGHLFTKIAINPHAPDHAELFPPILAKTKTHKNGRPWWFYNEVDFEPFSGDETLPPS